MSVVSRVFAFAACAAVSAGLLTAQEPKPVHPTHHATAKPADPAAGKQQANAFVIVQKADGYQVVSKADAEAMKHQAEQTYHEARATYEKERKAAMDAHQKFDKPAPRMVPVHTVGGQFATESAAQAEVKKLEDEKAAQAKKAAEHPATTDHPSSTGPHGGKHKHW